MALQWCPPYNPDTMLYDPNGPDGVEVFYVISRPDELVGKHYGFEFVTCACILPSFDEPLAQTTAKNSTSMYWFKRMLGLACVAFPLLDRSLPKMHYRLYVSACRDGVYVFECVKEELTAVLAPCIP